MISPLLLQRFVVIGIIGYWSVWCGEIVRDWVGRIQREVSDCPLTRRQVYSLHIIYSNLISVGRVGRDSYPINPLEPLYQAASHSQTIISDIIDLSKVKVYRLKIYYSDSHLQAFWDVMIATQMQAIARGMGFQIKIPSYLLAGIGIEKTTLRQVWLNDLAHVIKGIEQSQSAALKVFRRCGKEAIFGFERVFLSLPTALSILIVAFPHRAMQSFDVSSTHKRTVRYGLARLSSRQTLRASGMYPKQQDERQIPFASKLRDSVQKFLKKAIAPPVERDLYPERSL